MTSIRNKPHNTGITGGLKNVKNNEVPAKQKKVTNKKPESGWKPAKPSPTQTPSKPPLAR